MQKEDKRKYPRTWLYTMLRPLASVLFRLIYPFRVIDRDKMCVPEAPYLLIANHNSNFDALVLAWLCPYELYFLGKKELIKGRFTRWFLQDKLHMIPISRTDNDINAMRACMNALKQGNVLCVFPEGTRQPDKLMERVEKGVALMAMRQKANMVPVYIGGRPRLFRRNVAVVGDALLAADYPQGPYTDAKGDALCRTITETFLALQKRAGE